MAYMRSGYPTAYRGGQSPATPGFQRSAPVGPNWPFDQLPGRKRRRRRIAGPLGLFGAYALYRLFGLINRAEHSANLPEGWIDCGPCTNCQGAGCGPLQWQKQTTNLGGSGTPSDPCGNWPPDPCNGQTTQSGLEPIGSAISESAESVYLYGLRLETTNRYIQQYVYRRPVTGDPVEEGWYVPPGQAPYYWPDELDDEGPVPWDWPEALPIRKPAAPPVPPPWRAIPARSPGFDRTVQRTVRGHQRRVTGRAQANRSVRLRPDAEARPQLQRFVPRRPARARTRERKVAMRLAGTMAVLVNAVTEGVDFTDALFDALPEGCRRHKSGSRAGQHIITPQGKAHALWDCFAQLDLVSALENIALNQLEDWLLGKVGQRAGQAARDLGFDGPGIQTGPADGMGPGSTMPPNLDAPEWYADLQAWAREAVDGVAG